MVIVEELQGTWATGSTLYKITKRIELSNDIFNPHGTYKFLENSNQESHLYVRSKLDFFQQSISAISQIISWLKHYENGNKKKYP